MSEEIKEILDRLERIDHKEYSCGFEFADSGSFDEDCRCFEERKKLADYITNLQQIEEEHRKLNGELRKEISELQNNRDKAIEYLNQPYRDSFDYSKAELINILESDEQ